MKNLNSLFCETCYLFVHTFWQFMNLDGNLAVVLIYFWFFFCQNWIELLLKKTVKIFITTPGMFLTYPEKATNYITKKPNIIHQIDMILRQIVTTKFIHHQRNILSNFQNSSLNLEWRISFILNLWIWKWQIWGIFCIIMSLLT